LESSPIVRLLNEKFVSSWTLVAELKNIAANATEVEVTKAAKCHLDSYKFPVESVVALPNGTVLSRMNANDLMEGNSNGHIEIPPGFEDDLGVMYYQFLEEGLAKARELQL